MFKRRRRSGRLARVTAGAPRRDDGVEGLFERPEFALLTFDAQHWIDPCTGALVACPFEWRQAALDHLRRFDHWHKRPVKPLEELRTVRWLHHLRTELREDRRLRLFADDGRWLDPISGAWTSVRRTGTTITLACLEAIAQTLAAHGEVGPDDFRPLDALQERWVRERAGDGPRTEFRLAGFEVEPGTDTHLALLRRDHEQWLRQVPALPGCELGLLNRPVEAVGGDFYLFEELADGRHFLVLGDVSGHGTGAALIASLAVAAFRGVCRAHHDPVDILVAANDRLMEQLQPGQFLTCFTASYEPDEGALEVVCAGHHPAVIGNRRGPTLLRLIGRPGLALGIRRGPDLRRQLTPEHQTLAPGETLFAYTDGLCEARNQRDRQLGHQGAYAAFMGQLKGDCRRIVGNLWAQLRQYTGDRLDDDLSLLVLRRLGTDD